MAGSFSASFSASFSGGGEQSTVTGGAGTAGNAGWRRRQDVEDRIMQARQEEEELVLALLLDEDDGE